MVLNPATIGAANANTCINVVQQLLILRPTLQEIVTQNTNVPFGNEWGDMNTVALNSDGTPGSQDSSPTSAHPLNATSYGITGYFTVTQLNALLALCVSTLSFLQGSAISANGATPGTLASVETNAP